MDLTLPPPPPERDELDALVALHALLAESLDAIREMRAASRYLDAILSGPAADPEFLRQHVLRLAWQAGRLKAAYLRAGGPPADI